MSNEARRINMLFLGMLNEAEVLADKIKKMGIPADEAEKTIARLRKELYVMDSDAAEEIDRRK